MAARSEASVRDGLNSYFMLLTAKDTCPQLNPRESNEAPRMKLLGWTVIDSQSEMYVHRVHVASFSSTGSSDVSDDIVGP